MKAAYEQRIPPTLLFLPKRTNPNKWTLIDKALLLGWQTYQDELCPRCGVPMWLGHSEDPNIIFELKETVCYSCKDIESDKKEAGPGVTKYTTPT